MSPIDLISVKGKLKLTRVPDDNDVAVGDVVGADDGHSGVVRVGHGELPLRDVERVVRRNDLGLHGAEPRGGFFEMRILKEEGVEAAGRVVDRHAVDQQRHVDDILLRG